MPGDEDMTTPANSPSRVGSNADLARRMDRMEGRQDNIETEVRTLGAVVSRVEMNQQHGTELAKLRFDAIDNGMKAGFADLAGFQTRIEGILDGSIVTAQARQGQELVNGYIQWRKEAEPVIASVATTLPRVVERIEVLERGSIRQTGINSGIGQTFGTAKATIVTAAAVVTAVVTVLGALGFFNT